MSGGVSKPDTSAPHTTVDDLSARVSAKLGTPYRIYTERDVCRRRTIVTLHCSSCKQTLMTGADDDDLEDGIKTIGGMVDLLAESVLTCRQPDFYEEGDCTCVDGYTVDQCLMHWRDNIRTADLYGASGAYAALTERQRNAARLAWSAELKRKQAEAKEKERNEVCVDDDRWEP